MAYNLREVTIHTNNSERGMQQIGALWQDITSGKLPLLFDSTHQFLPGVSPVSRYSNYASDENGDYDLTVMAVQSDFFANMEGKVQQGLYKKYDVKDADGSVEACTQKAWAAVWAQQKAGEIHRTFTEDYESSVPAQYTKDGCAHCYLYIAAAK